MKTVYVPLMEINELQTKVMQFVDHWARTKKTPIPFKAIIDAMENQSVNRPSTIGAINALLHKGYIRRAVIVSNKSSFVQLRGVVMSG